MEDKQRIFSKRDLVRLIIPPIVEQSLMATVRLAENCFLVHMQHLF